MKAVLMRITHFLRVHGDENTSHEHGFVKYKTPNARLRIRFDTEEEYWTFRQQLEQGSWKDEFFLPWISELRDVSNEQAVHKKEAADV